MTSAHAPHGEAWIVGNDRADADDDGIDRRPQRMHVVQRARPVDPLAFAGQGRDAAVERLPELSHDEWAIARRPGDSRNGRVAEGRSDGLCWHMAGSELSWSAASALQAWQRRP